jgi:hypothetical protein
MHRFMVLTAGTLMTFAAFVGTGYAAFSVRDALSERFKPSRTAMARGSDEGHVVEKGTVLRLTADGIPAGLLRTTQLNTKSPRFHVHDYARVAVDERGRISAEAGRLALAKGTRMVVLNLKTDRGRVRLFTHTLDPVQLPDGTTVHGCTEFVFAFDPTMLNRDDIATVTARIEQWLAVDSAS